MVVIGNVQLCYRYVNSITLAYKHVIIHNISATTHTHHTQMMCNQGRGIEAGSGGIQNEGKSAAHPHWVWGRCSTNPQQAAHDHVRTKDNVVQLNCCLQTILKIHDLY